MSRLLLWEEKKLGKTHLVGQDVKAPVMRREEVGEDSPGWSGCQGSCYGKRSSWVRLTWLTMMSRLLYGRKRSWGRLTWVARILRLHVGRSSS
jgi:hypothetical protein